MRWTAAKRENVVAFEFEAACSPAGARGELRRMEAPREGPTRREWTTDGWPTKLDQPEVADVLQPGVGRRQIDSDGRGAHGLLRNIAASLAVGQDAARWVAISPSGRFASRGDASGGIGGLRSRVTARSRPPRRRR